MDKPVVIPKELRDLAGCFEVVTGVPMGEAISDIMDGRNNQLMHKISENARPKDPFQEAIKEMYNGICLCGAPSVDGICSVPDCVCSRKETSAERID